MYSFLPVDSDAYFEVGDLNGVTSGSWLTITLTFDPTTPSNFLLPSAIEYLVRLRTESAGAQSIYVDQIVVSDGAQGPSPAPVTAQPVAGPTAPPVTAPPVAGPTTPPVTAPPVAGPTTPPVTAPPVPTPTAPPVAAPTDGATAAFVEVVSGAAILADQISGGPLAVADQGATSDTDTSIAFAATSAEAAAYEMYFPAPAAVTGP
ncbi:unnamed protein product, partial [Ectocarpus sp. 13 AM-2016]